jgi:hypothetical protein
MHLVRLASLGWRDLPEPWRQMEIKQADRFLRTLVPIDEAGREGGPLMSAYIPLCQRPEIDGDGLVVIPPGSREEAERMIETMADRIAIATDRARAIGSPAQAEAFQANEPEDLVWLCAQKGIAGFDRIAPSHGFTVNLEPTTLNCFADRGDGAALLADALSGSTAEDEFLGFLRVFERAFRESSDRLIPFLARFLETRPGLKFTKTEVKRWITKLRGAVVHADKKQLPIEADYRPAIPRMKFAAYDVLLNKATWRDNSSDRREAWTPTTAPSPDGELLVAQHSEGPGRAQLLDAFGVYPLDLSSQNLELPEDHWPRRGPKDSRGSAMPVEVCDKEMLAVSPQVARPAGEVMDSPERESD